MTINNKVPFHAEVISLVIISLKFLKILWYLNRFINFMHNCLLLIVELDSRDINFSGDNNELRGYHLNNYKSRFPLISKISHE